MIVFSCLEVLGIDVFEIVFATRNPELDLDLLTRMEQVATQLSVPYDPSKLTIVNRTASQC